MLCRPPAPPPHDDENFSVNPPSELDEDEQLYHYICLMDAGTSSLNFRVIKSNTSSHEGALETHESKNKKEALANILFDGPLQYGVDDTFQCVKTAQRSHA